MKVDEIAPSLPLMTFDHIVALSDERGIHEHAEYAAPRPEHGYCTDDVARALTVVVCEPGFARDRKRLIETYLAFLESAIVANGAAHNRMAPTGEWTDAATTDDWWGRALAGLGSVIRHSHDPVVRRRALRAFRRGAVRRSVDVRASSFAAIGCADVLRAHPLDRSARDLLADCLMRIPERPLAEWEWSEPRLRYANAALCDALIMGGEALGRPAVTRRGLELLAALIRIETGPAGHLSPTGTSGRGPGEPGPLWDQQPIEVAAIADACAHAYDVTRDPFWIAGIRLAWRWFAGENDSRTQMYDPRTGAGFDGLTPLGRNENRGAESTLAAMRTLQRVRAIPRPLVWTP